ncbi:helix-turn-helix domain-containing protein [Paenibacillus filicis]|uniref:Helix-turn-helix domain-containing protein n=1 Tax=Paenibacillus filicis TaxID=669464 RepID=A0ABU9DK00_9BACL
MERSRDRHAIQELVERNGLLPVFHPEVIAAMELRIYTDREIVCAIGDYLEGLQVLVKGRLKIHTSLPNGKTMLLRFTEPPTLIGDVEWMARYPVGNTVEAVGATMLLFVSRECLLEKEMDNPAFLQFMIRNLSHKLFTNGQSTALNRLYPLENRFASYLLALLPDQDPASSGRARELRTSTLGEMAELLGTSYRHLNRVIARLTQEGVVERKRGGLRVLDESRLRELAHNHRYI